MGTCFHAWFCLFKDQIKVRHSRPRSNRDNAEHPQGRLRLGCSIAKANQEAPRPAACLIDLLASFFLCDLD